MLYGLETVALTERQKAEMEVTELKMLRFSLAVTRMDKIRKLTRISTSEGQRRLDGLERENTRGKIHFGCPWIKQFRKFTCAKHWDDRQNIEF